VCGWVGVSVVVFVCMCVCERARVCEGGGGRLGWCVDMGVCV